MENSLLVHKHLIVRAEASRPPMDEEQLTEWMKEFVESINMKIFMGPYVKYCSMPGNRGITAVAIIETSHIAMHIWDEPNPALMQFDVYSCGEFDVEKICKKIKKDFDIKKIEYKFLNRETGLRRYLTDRIHPIRKLPRPSFIICKFKVSTYPDNFSLNISHKSKQSTSAVITIPSIIFL